MDEIKKEKINSALEKLINQPIKKLSLGKETFSIRFRNGSEFIVGITGKAKLQAQLSMVENYSC